MSTEIPPEPSKPWAPYRSAEEWVAMAKYEFDQPRLEAYLDDVQQIIAEAMNGKPVTREELKALLEKHKFKAEGLKE